MLTVLGICETCLCETISRNDSLGCSTLKTWMGDGQGGSEAGRRKAVGISGGENDIKIGIEIFNSISGKNLWESLKIRLTTLKDFVTS